MPRCASLDSRRSTDCQWAELWAHRSHGLRPCRSWSGIHPRERREVKLVFSLLAFVFGALSAFFAYYTARLLYINVTVPGVAQHRQGGMYIGAIIFPIARL